MARVDFPKLLYRDYALFNATAAGVYGLSEAQARNVGNSRSAMASVKVDPSDWQITGMLLKFMLRTAFRLNGVATNCDVRQALRIDNDVLSGSGATTVTTTWGAALNGSTQTKTPTPGITTDFETIFDVPNVVQRYVPNVEIVSPGMAATAGAIVIVSLFVMNVAP